jgi:hypothetical protein
MESSLRRHPLWLLLVSGILGFRVGMIGFPDWQVAVETAQVVAGIVEYPAGNPFYVYHTKLWTVLHQMLAFLLWAGVSEITLSRLVSGVLGMVSFQALSMFVYAFSGDFLLAVGSAFVIFLSRASELGAVYPIWLMGTSHTYGVLGLSTGVLTAALLGAGSYRTGAFLLGLGPAIHPSLGLWLAVVVALGIVSNLGAMRDPCRMGLKYFLAGAAVAGVSLGYQLAVIVDAPPIDAGTAAKFMSAFVTHWDTHRQPIGVQSLDLRINLFALLLAIVSLKGFAASLSPASAFLLRVVAASGFLSVVLVLITWLPPDRLPATFLVLMPLRILNLNSLTAAALLIGLARVSRRTIWGHLLTMWLAAGLLLANRSMLWSVVGDGRRPAWLGQLDPMFVLQVAAIVLGAVALYLAGARRVDAVPSNRSAAGIARMAAAGIPRLATLAFLAYAAVVTWRFSGPTLTIFRDRTNDPFFGLVSEGRGLLLTGADLHLVQLRTRRPVLLDGGGLDGLPYSIEAGPAMHRILLDVYGIDLFRPPAEPLWGVIPHEANKAVWEGYTRGRWREIKQAYNVTQVLTYDTWTLDLPVTAQRHGLRLFEIPD